MAPDSQTLIDILDALNVAVVATDEDDTIIVFNKIAGEMLEQDPESRIGTSLYLCHAEQSEPGVRKMIEEMRTKAVEKYDGALNFRGRHLHEYICPIWGQDGSYRGMLITIHDAAEKTEFLKRLGEFQDIHLSGVGEKAPRPPRG